MVHAKTRRREGREKDNFLRIFFAALRLCVINLRDKKCARRMRGASPCRPNAIKTDCSGQNNIADIRSPVHYRAMAKPVYLFEFTGFVVGDDTVVCIAPLSTVLPFMTLAELEEAFSGYASYRQAPWMMRYVGVWGRKNCQRFRRFLRERGADVSLRRERPNHLRLTSWVTHGKRTKVRLLSQLSTNSSVH